MLAYHNNPELKTQFVALIEQHRAADQIAQGHGYWQDERGCAIGCSIHSLNQITGSRAHTNDHGAYETLIGVPRILAKLEDGIFEALPADRAQLWPGEFADAIRPGADLALVWPRFAVWLLVDEADGVIRYAKTDAQRTAIRRVADLYVRAVAGGTVDRQTWRDAADAAAAAAYAAWAADAAAADAADAAAARSLARVRQADRLLELLRAA